MFPRTALVTGGASGIGAAVARMLEREGARVRVLDLVYGFDVAQPAAWDEVPPAELACLNAGVATGEGRLTALSDSAYRRVMSANIDGVVLGTRHLARVMAPGGAIVVTASLAGLAELPSDPIYALTKHALIGFVRSVAPQLEERGIRISAVAPGIVETPLIGATRHLFEEAGFPLLAPDEVARALLLAARHASPGEVWVVQPGRQPGPFRFSNVPGARRPDGTRAGRPPLH
ncbi:MAG TPA: SDR family NAD(P)-dependent oxidoreductase [Acidimicrobiales bacterium]|nr:SDR family NAD(P)-dependent oxidoreductase [Acidimicrobiales bacterium]